MISRMLWLIVVFMLTYTVKLVSWNEGFERGYGMGMADAVIDETKPQKFFKRQK